MIFAQHGSLLYLSPFRLFRQPSNKWGPGRTVFPVQCQLSAETTAWPTSVVTNVHCAFLIPP